MTGSFPFQGKSLCFLTLLMGWGCATPSMISSTPLDPKTHDEAFKCLKVALKYPYNPAVRAEAVEAFATDASEEARPWIRSALLDDHPAVRFAACMAVGDLKDFAAETAVRKCLSDADANVRVAAIFAVHRLGDTANSSELTAQLLDHDGIAVRRNAALVLGRIETPSAIKVLARAMNDVDPGVRHHALEAMAMLGNRDARQELVFLSNSGVGSDEVFAVNALAALRDPILTDTFRYKFETAVHPETRLAAARGLGLLGDPSGFDFALRSLNTQRPPVDDPKDPPQDQVLRMRQLAAAALGAIRKREALPPLLNTMKTSPDPRVQVASARAILEILKPAADRGPRNGIALKD